MVIDVALLIAIVIALTEFVKMLGLINNRYLPAVSLVLGIIAGVVYLDDPLKDAILYGILIGLSASGLFDQSKIVTKGGKK